VLQSSTGRAGLRGWCIVIPLLILSGTGHAAPSAALGYAPKYPVGFKHFDYINPAAPKGGEVTLLGRGTFDSLNPYVLKGVAAEGLGQYVFEPLMVQSLDEPYSVYAHLAEDIELAPDRLSVSFRLDPRARFSNGQPVTAADVKFSFDTLMSKAAHPMFRLYWADLKRAVVVNPRTVRFEFARVNPELHLVVSQIPVFARAWVGDKPFDKLATVTPIGSGPYRVLSFDLGKRIVYERNPDYWARDLNTRRGMFNFDRVVVKYYKDDTVMLEAFKAGEFDFIHEYSSKLWARNYTGPQFEQGRILKVELEHRNNAGMQGFTFNIRRPLFKDRRVRRAITLALDFEWSNRKLFYNQYKRCDSYFSNSELAATGLPDADELRLLEPFRSKLPPELFTKPWEPPSTAPPGSLRENLRQARELLAQAGWQLDQGVLRNARGEPFEFEVMLTSVQGRGFERILAPFARNLEKLGIQMKYRSVDTSLYQRRTDTFDFDMMVASFAQSQSPGNELITRWHSSSASQEGSDNVIGIRDPVVDALIEKVIFAPDRRRLITATRALDRVLLHGEYLVPNWYIATHRVAYWDKFGIPENKPLYYAADGWMRMSWWKK
jgi:microcin C transport system substrate-binding protein